MNIFTVLICSIFIITVTKNFMKLKNLFTIRTRHYYRMGIRTGFVKFRILTVLGFRFCIYEGYKINFEWADAFRKYFNSHNMKSKIKNLKRNMDSISCEYIDFFMKLSKVWGKYRFADFWSKYDKKLIKKYKELNFEQPFPDITKFNSFTFLHKYGLADLPKDVLEFVNGKDIIDAGGLNGDTALIFNNLFPKSNIYVYEPLSEYLNIIKKVADKVNLNKEEKIIPIKKGLSNKQEICNITFDNYSENCAITTLDSDYNDENPGLIKMDTEGFESKIVEGASNLIKQYKPVLVIAIYHTPEDFFEMKDKIFKLNPEYRFMIRRSEFIIPTADFILIAY